jgi:hypothetical protein
VLISKVLQGIVTGSAFRCADHIFFLFFLFMYLFPRIAFISYLIIIIMGFC